MWREWKKLWSLWIVEVICVYCGFNWKHLVYIARWNAKEMQTVINAKSNLRRPSKYGWHNSQDLKQSYLDLTRWWKSLVDTQRDRISAKSLTGTIRKRKSGLRTVIPDTQQVEVIRSQVHRLLGDFNDTLFQGTKVNAGNIANVRVLV